MLIHWLIRLFLKLEFFNFNIFNTGKGSASQKRKYTTQIYYNKLTIYGRFDI